MTNTWSPLTMGMYLFEFLLVELRRKWSFWACSLCIVPYSSLRSRMTSRSRSRRGWERIRHSHIAPHCHDRHHPYLPLPQPGHLGPVDRSWLGLLGGLVTLIPFCIAECVALCVVLVCECWEDFENWVFGFLRIAPNFQLYFFLQQQQVKDIYTSLCH